MSQESFISSITTHALLNSKSLVYSTTDHAKNIFNFSTQYLNSTPGTRNSLANGPFIHHLHSHSVCKFYVFFTLLPTERRILKMTHYTLDAKSQSFSPLLKPFPCFQTAYYLTISLFLSPSTITGYSLRPGLILISNILLTY